MGARYLDPKYSRWISVDPALGEYIPAAGKGNSENAGNLPGMGGIYNHINGDLYHYAANNPVRYVDPNGLYTSEEQIEFMLMSADKQLSFLFSEYQSVSNSSNKIRGEKASEMRELRTLMDLEGLFEANSDFMDGELRLFLNLNENGTMDYSYEELFHGEKDGWTLQPELGSLEHQRTAQNGEYNRKFTNSDGREVVFRNVGPDKWEVVTGISGDSYLDQGTFNYGNPNPLPFSIHGLYDMTPFFIKNSLPSPWYWFGYMPSVKGL